MDGTMKRRRSLQLLRVSATLALLCLGATFLLGSKKSTRSGLPLSLFASSLFMGPGHCAVCHDSDGETLMTKAGEDLSIPEAWRSTMMANAFHDPYFQAVLEHEVALRPSLQVEIEDTCLTCHAPMARTQALYDGQPHLTLAAARQSALASDGVSCTVCHQIQPTNLGTPASYSGHYIIDDSRTIFGPYDGVYQFAMQSAVNYTPTFGAHMPTSELCATCHTLFTPILDEEENIIGQFPEQTPYLEWKNSEFASIGSLMSCQDCHMPRIEEPVFISHDPPIEPRSPFWRHHFAGGNAFMLTMLRNNVDALGLTASEEQFDTTIERTLRQLQERTAILEIVRTEVTGNTVSVTVRVTNKAGHKFPTGYPARRAWIHFVARSTDSTILFESGSWDSAGEIVGPTPPFEPHHDLITSQNQVQIYEGIIGDLQGAPTTALLSAAQYLKDNRLPPKGFRSDGPDIAFTGIKGDALTDPNFNRDGATEGTGTDLVTYQFPIAVDPAEVEINVSLVYQSLQPRFVDKLRPSPTTAGETFLAMYDQMTNSPITITKGYATLQPPSSFWTLY